MAVYRGKIRWTIPGAGTAYSVLHFADIAGDGAASQAEADEIIAKMQTWATAIKSTLPNVVTLQVQNEVEHILSTTGDLIDIWTGASQTAQTGTASATAGWAAAAGAVVSWSTAGVRNGRRVRGRTFLVPLSNEVWDTDGTLKSVPLGTINSAATALRTVGTTVQLAVHTRPSAPGASDGDHFPVTGHRTPDMSAILRSRRS